MTSGPGSERILRAFELINYMGDFERPAIDTPTHQAVNAAVGPRLDLPCLAFAIEFGFALLPVRVSHGHGHGPWHTAAQRCGYPFEFRIKPNQTESGQAKWN